MSLKLLLRLLIHLLLLTTIWMVSAVSAAGLYSENPDNSIVQITKIDKIKDKKLKSAKTKNILKIFEAISQIPRCSKNEAAISNWLVDWAQKRKFAVNSDEFKNVLITAPATRGFEHLDTIVLQAHMDMVCQKAPDSLHDFTKDPIELIREGDWIRANDTTLGADDGIGIAIALAIADYPAIDHPKLEILITTDEEVDMTGAAGLSETLLTGKKYINIDSETEGVVTIGAAGGIKSILTRPLPFLPISEDLAVFSLEISGLLGGHSGIDIDKGRANANYLVAQALDGIVPLRMINFSGGTADNVITDSSEILFAISPEDTATLENRIIEFEQEAREQYPTETGMTVSLSEMPNTSQLAASESVSADCISLVASLPQGVYEWSTEFDGIPETSNNIGILTTETENFKINTMARSFDPQKLDNIASLIESTSYIYGGSAERGSTFPSWPPNTDSELYEDFLESYQTLFDAPMVSEVIHAGLECGYIIEKYPEMEIVSIGPTLEDVHSYREKLYIPSLEKIALLIAEVMRSR